MLKLTRTPDQEDLLTFENLANEVMPFALTFEEFRACIHRGVGLAAQCCLYRSRVRYGFTERHLADDHQIDVTCGSEYCRTRERAVDEGNIDAVAQRFQRLSKVLDDPGGLRYEATEILINR